MIPNYGLLLALIATALLGFVQPIMADAPDSSQTAVVRSVILKGNYRTRDRIILREMTLHVGDTVRQVDLPGRVAWDQRNINNTNLFVTVDVTTSPALTADSLQLPQIDVTVLMKERWYLIAYPVFDLADRNFNEWWYDRGRDFRRVIYGGRLSYRNITGTNDRMQVVVERGFLSRTVLSYSRPYIDRAQKIGMRVDFSYQTNKEIPYRTAADKWLYVRSDDRLRERMFAGLLMTYRRGLYHYHTVETRFTRNTIADTIARLNPDYFLDGRTRQRFMSLNYAYRYDRRDNVAYPLRGTLFTVAAGLSGILPNDSFHYVELLGSVTRYWSLGGRFYLANNLRGRIALPERQPYFNLIGLGSSLNVLRGYELYVIDGQRFGVWRNSLRYQLFSTVKQLNWLPVRQFNTVPIAAYVTAFGDMGYVSSTVAEQYQSQLANRLLMGTGVGLDIVTFYNMILRFSATLNRQGQTGFYFNLAQEF